MKIIEFHWRILKNLENNRIPSESYENHENHGIPFENHENHENHEILYENQENHENQRNCMRIIKS